jgi:hypothetical protein
MNSQTTRIYGHLTRGSITPLQALRRYGVFRLAARINDLRKRGHSIKTERVEQGGKSFARYSMQ